MAVCLLLHAWLVLPFAQHIQCHAAVASLVGLRHPKQSDAEGCVLGIVQCTRCMQGIVTLLVHVWREEPDVPQVVGRMRQSARLLAYHRDIGSFGAYVGDVGHRDAERVGVVFSVGCRWKDERETMVRIFAFDENVLTFLSVAKMFLQNSVSFDK